MQAILALLKPFWAPILKFGGIALAGLLFWLQAKKSGEATIKQQNLENTLKTTQDYDNAKDTVSRDDDTDIDKLLQKYTRD